MNEPSLYFVFVACCSIACIMKIFNLLQLALILSQVQAFNNTLVTCSGLSNAILQYSSIRFTTPIVAGSNFTGDAPESSYNIFQTALPYACRVACEIQTSRNSTARFEVWLPAKASWNSRFLAVGNVGWAGGINYLEIVMGLKQGERGK